MDNTRRRKMLITMNGNINAGRDTKKPMIFGRINGFVLIFDILSILSIMTRPAFCGKNSFGW